MAKFKMILLGSQRIEINSKNTNEEKLNWFIDEILKYKIDAKSNLFIKIYKSGKKFAEYKLSQKDINELTVKWINYKTQQIKN